MRLPRFSLRALFAAITIFGIWLGVQMKWIRDRHAAIEWAKSKANHNVAIVGKAITAPLTLRIFGEQGYKEIGLYTGLKDPTYTDDKLKELFPEARVWRSPW